MAYTYDTDTEVYTVSFGSLEDLLYSLPANTAQTPYKLNVTNLDSSKLQPSENSNTIGHKIKQWSRYVDLSYTTLPDNVTNMYRSFDRCTYLVKPPEIPYGVTFLKQCFCFCISLITAPNIPDSVTNMLECFALCKSLVTAPNIPDSVEVMQSCFDGCLSLITAPNIPDSVYNLIGCFSNCTSLVTVPRIPHKDYMRIWMCFYNCTNLKTIESWELKYSSNIDLDAIFTGCNSLESIFCTQHPTHTESEKKYLYYDFHKDNGSLVMDVLDRNGDTVVSDVTIDNSTPTIEGKIDELYYADEGVEDVISDLIEYKVPLSSKDVINPSKKSFLLYAQNPSELHTNMVFPNGIETTCTTAGSEEHKEITLAKWTGESVPNNSELYVTFTYGNEYGDTTASPATHPDLKVYNADNTLIGTFDICDSRGHSAGTGCWNDGDLIIFKKVGTKVLITNHDIRQNKSSKTIYSDGSTIIDDTTVATNKTWSSSKIETAMLAQEGPTGTTAQFLAYLANNTSHKALARCGSCNLTDGPNGNTWYNYIFNPHRNGVGGDNYQYGTLILTDMVANSGNMWMKHLIGTAWQGDWKFIGGIDTSNFLTKINTGGFSSNSKSLKSTQTTEHGYIAIWFNDVSSFFSNNMFSFKLRVTEYDPGIITEYTIKGYAYESGRFYNCAATMTSNSSAYNNSFIYFGGNTGGQGIILIGKNGTGEADFNYPQIDIYDISCGFANPNSDFVTNCNIAITSAAAVGWARQDEAKYVTNLSQKQFDIFYADETLDATTLWNNFTYPIIQKCLSGRTNGAAYERHCFGTYGLNLAGGAPMSICGCMYFVTDNTLLIFLANGISSPLFNGAVLSQPVTVYFPK